MSGRDAPSLRQPVEVNAKPFRWTWRECLRIAFYNEIRRPWNNFRWWLHCAFDGEFKRKFPNHPWGYPKAGRLDRATMEWAHGVMVKHAQQRPPLDDIGV